VLSRIKHQIGERILHRLLPNQFYFKQSGFCPCCQQTTEFVAYHAWLRDSFRCVACGSSPRNRAMLLMLDKHRPNWPSLSIHESSPSVGGASARLRSACSQYVASQYFPNEPFGVPIKGFRNEDLESQTFAAETFDIVVTQDVLEHVYNPALVFAEIARTLKPGGAHIFSVPLVNKHQPSQVWATRNSDGSAHFLHEPDFHGNPVDPRGSPVTMHWGYDIVDFIQQACGLATVIEHVDDLEHGVRAEYIEILVTEKPGLPDRRPGPMTAD